MSRTILLTILALLTAPLGAWSADAPTRPNILWIIAEDLSPNLGCYGDKDAHTPRLDAFAKRAIRFIRAFSTASVCAPSRSCLITGMYATSLGTQRLRSQTPIPDDFTAFTTLLRRAGYYCTNNAKTDYNLINEKAFVGVAWNNSSSTAHWRNRRNDEPFFAVFNLGATHQSRTSAWPHEKFEKEIGSKLSPGERSDPAKVTLPPFYPNTAETRRAWARYLDCIALVDRQVGELLDQLHADGLLESTIVYFFSDHGMGMPRGKRCLQDSGLQVPLLVHFPKQLDSLAPLPAGSVSDRLVSFVDFAPSVLNLCGVKAPKHFQGNAFLGPDVRSPREFVYGARDRVDEAFDVARSVRDGRWLYIRNFMPHLSWMQPEGYSDKSTFRQELVRLATEKKLGPGPMTYAAPRRQMEELYDTRRDPYQLQNLALLPEHRSTLEKMRSELRRWQLDTRDAGFFTEPQMSARFRGNATPWSIAHDNEQYPLSRILDVANAVGRDESAALQHDWLRDPNDGIRYWSVIGLHARSKLDQADRLALRAALKDASEVVRIEAASALGQHGEAETALPILMDGLRHESLEVVLHSARALELLGTAALPVHAEMRTALASARNKVADDTALPLFICFSLEAALKQ